MQTTNGSFIAIANNGTTTLTVQNANSTAQTHAGTATDQDTTNVLTYFMDGAAQWETWNVSGPNCNIDTSAVVATISSSGLLTANNEGSTVVEVSHPTFNNNCGVTGAQSPNPMHGLPLMKIYAEVSVIVVP